MTGLDVLSEDATRRFNELVYGTLAPGMPQRTRVLYKAHAWVQLRSRTNFVVNTSAGQFRMELPKSSPFPNKLDSRNIHEPPLTEALLDLLEPNSVVWDIGGARGYHTLLAAQRVPDSQIHTFEPNPYFQYILSHNLDLNDVCPTVVPDFVSDKQGTDRVTGTHYAQETVNPNVIKIDVEGWESSVLTGMNDLLATVMPTVAIEVHPAINPRVHPSVYDQLVECGYDVRQVKKFRSPEGGLSEVLDDPKAIDHDGYYMLLASPPSGPCPQV